VKQSYIMILTSLVCWGVATIILAAPASDNLEQQTLRQQGETNSGRGGFASELANILIALAVVLAVIYLLVRLLRRFFPVLVPAAGPTAPVKPLARFYLGPKQIIHLVRCGSRVLLLGATPANITYLGSIDDPAEVEEILKNISPTTSPLKGLGRLFHRASDSPDTSQQGPLPPPKKTKEQP